MVDRQVEQRRELARLPIDDDMLTEHTANFAIRDVIRTIVEQAPDGASVRDVLEVARIMGRTSVTRCVPVGPSRSSASVSDTPTRPSPCRVHAHALEGDDSTTAETTATAILGP